MRITAVLLLAALAGAGCRSAAGAAGGAPMEDRGRIVILGTDLTTGGLLLDALVHRMPQMQVARPTGGCPIINLRGRRPERAVDNASVYVDGTRMRDTCVLLQILASDVERVELFPIAAGRPDGFRPGPGGLIVIYRRR